MGAHLGVWGFTPSHSPTFLGAQDVTPGLPSWPTSLQTLALVASPRLGLWHKRLHEINMKIHPKKCEFVVTLVVYLGHIILPNGVMAHCAKIVTILEMSNPTIVHTLRSFIRLCNYYNIYVQDFNTIVHPLYALLKKDVAWTWSEKAQGAFNTFKERLSKFPILRKLDFSKVFILHID